MTKSKKVLPPIHPGEILREDFMTPLGLSMNKLALELHVPVTRIAEIVLGKIVLLADNDQELRENAVARPSVRSPSVHPSREMF